jgi:hypothetical protein
MFIFQTDFFERRSSSLCFGVVQLCENCTRFLSSMITGSDAVRVNENKLEFMKPEGLIGSGVILRSV